MMMTMMLMIMMTMVRMISIDIIISGFRSCYVFCEIAVGLLEPLLSFYETCHASHLFHIGRLSEPL